MEDGQHQLQQDSAMEEAAENTESTEQDYSWPAIRFDLPPYGIHHFYKQFRTGPNPNNFLKGVKWYRTFAFGESISFLVTRLPISI